MDLNEQQRRAVEHTEGPLLIVAGAGTGKTRVIVERIGFLLRTVQPENILALTFGESAAAEMKQRAAARFGDMALRCRFSTFHGFCYQILSKQSPWKAMDETDHWIFLRRNLEKLELDHYLRVSEPGRFLGDLLEFCSRCHDNLVGASDFNAYVEKLASDSLATSQSGPETSQQKVMEREIARHREVARVFACSEKLQEEAGLLSFGAMIARAVALLRNSPDLLRRLHRRYRFILVDEFQDTNWAQIELLRLLAGKSRNVTAVGDRKQAIYHFRGASRASFDLFKETFPQNASPIVLSENYRSTKSILAVAGAAIACSEEQYGPDELLTTSNAAGRKVEVWEFSDEHEQAEFLAREISRQFRTAEARSYSDFAVLYRAHRHRDLLVGALRRHGVPFAIRKLAINGLSTVRDIIACLRAIGLPRDSISLLRIMAYERWDIDIGLRLKTCRKAYELRESLSEVIEREVGQGVRSDAPGLAALEEFLSHYRRIAKNQRIADWLSHLRVEMNFFGKPEEEAAWNTFLNFVLCWDKEKSETGLLDEFLEYFAYFEEAGGVITLPDDNEVGFSQGWNPDVTARHTSSDLQLKFWDQNTADDRSNKVQLMTIHGAKGLEFEKVFLLQNVRGSFPARRQNPLINFPVELLKGPKPEGDLHIEEERRLFYVALTRAKTRLALCTISNAKAHPSKFLEQLRKSNCPDLTWKTVAPSGAAQAFTGYVASPIAVQGSVEDSLVLSASGLESYLTCPLKYQFSYVWRVPVAPSAALRFGSIMHGAIKQMVQTLSRHPESIQPESLNAILQEKWLSAGFSDLHQESKYKEMGRQQLESLWRELSGKPFEVFVQEKTFQFAWGGITLRGRFDQINRLPGKGIELIEYKTGRAQAQKDVDNSRQITIYAKACREVLGLDPEAIILYNLTTQESLTTQRGPEDFRSLEGELRKASSNIIAGEFTARPGYHCRYCDFRPICPAQEDDVFQAANEPVESRLAP